MASRKRIGLIFSYNENWIAGAYYVLNIMHALNSLPDKEKPIIVILTESNDNLEKVKKVTNYPYLEFEMYPFRSKYSFVERVINKGSRFFFKKQLILKSPSYSKLDFLYPKQLNNYSDNLLKVNWIPDFQEDYLSQYFSKEEIESRKRFQKEIVANGDIVVLSSEDAKNDFVRLYPYAKAIPFVLRFAVTHPDFSDEKIEVIMAKYNLEKNYFFAPNQFWAHKNHIVVLKAVKNLIDKGIHVVVAMSGKQDDYRNKENFNSLNDFIKINDLDDHIKFLGFLPREEQLCLFKNAKAIIQPSLFEGWSTVIEDAKALGKFVIASDLGVHREQLDRNAMFFDPYDYTDLVKCIESFILEPPDLTPLDYDRNILEFGKEFIELVNMASKTQ